MNPPDDFAPKRHSHGITDLHPPRHSTEPGSVNRTAIPPPVVLRPQAEMLSHLDALERDRQPREPTDREAVANWMDRCRYLDLKGIAIDILGAEKRDGITPAELADLMAEWAAANKTKATQ